MHLAEVRAGFGTQNGPGDIGEARDAARTVGAELAVIFRANLARSVFLDIAPLQLPWAAQLGQPLADVDLGRRIRIGSAGVVHADAEFAGGRFEIDLAHGDTQRADMDLAAAANGPGGNADVEFRVDVGHAYLSAFENAGRITGGRYGSSPSLRRC